MKQSESASFTKSPNMATCLDDDTLIAKTILGISTLQLDMMGRIKKLEENQNTIMEESRLERQSKNNAIVEALEKHYDKEMGRFMEMVNLLVENMNRSSSRAANVVPTIAPNATIPPFQGFNVAAQSSFFPNQTIAAHSATAAPATLQPTPSFGNQAAVNHQQVSNFQQLLSSPYHLLQQQLALQQQQQQATAVAAAAAAAAVQSHQFPQSQQNPAVPLNAVRGVSLGNMPVDPAFPPYVTAQSNLPSVKTVPTATSTPLATKAGLFSTYSFKPASSQESSVQGSVATAFKPMTSGNLFGDAASRGFMSFSSVVNEAKATNSTEKNSPATSEIKKAENPVSIKVSSPAKDSGKPDDEVEEFVPTAHFEPVIPLPALVDTKTGEEDEEVLFKSRAKLYRYVKDLNEYKERGIGDIKILRSGDGKHRIVMRRDQVLKVCANVPLRIGMKINKKTGSENTCIWACTDYSENAEGVDECFVARFKTPQLVEEFIKIFCEAVDPSGVKKNNSKTSDKQADSGTTSFSQLKSIISGTEVETASSTPLNIASSKANTSAEKKDGSTGKKVEQGFGDAFKPPPGSWECKSCYTRNKADANVCPCCGTKKDGTAASSSFGAAVTSSSSSTAQSKEGNFSFGITTGVPFPKASTVEPNPANSSVSFGLSATNTTSSNSPPKTSSSVSGTGLPTFSFCPVSAAKSAPVSASSAFSTANVPSASKPKSVASSKTTKPTFSFAKPMLPVSTTSNDVKPTFSFATAAFKSPEQSNTNEKTFSFKPDGKTAFAQPKFGGSPIFGGKPTNLTSASKENGAVLNSGTNSLFGASAGNSPFSGSVFGGGSGKDFASLTVKSQNESKNSKPEGDDIKNNLFQSASFGKNEKPMFSAFSRSDSTKKDSTTKVDEDAEEFVPTAHFEPVIPLPALVETKTGEENEKILFEARAKLFRYDKVTREYKERGVGDVKVLQSQDGKRRVVMRRDQVLKVCANAPISPGTKIFKKPHVDNACIWMCKDFTDGIEGADECFVFRFKTAQLADEFLTFFHAAMNESQQSDVKANDGNSTEKKESNDAKNCGPCSSQVANDSQISNNRNVNDVRKCEGSTNYHMERYAVTAKIMDAFPSPMKPSRETEVEGTCVLRFRPDHEEVRFNLETPDGEIKLKSTVCAKDEFRIVEPNVMSCQVVEDEGRNVRITVTFVNAKSASSARDHLMKGKELAAEKEY